ncbi:MAG: hypothetical protein HKN37_01780 [Rhodothermales bacterium]|nr:hypothetical protein [Rhodothermales bacterium]
MPESKSCVAVFGVGRSGTSLAMKLLNGVGLRLSPDLVPPSPDNPTGHFEDLRINRAQQGLIKSIGMYALLPRPADWVSAPAYLETKKTLVAIVEEEVNRDYRPWGFKDPRTCLFWPLWEEVLRELDITPHVVFCVRPSSSVVSSLMTAYGLPQDLSEGIVLYRTFHALRDVQHPFFFLHYDRWQQDPISRITALAAHCGLDGQGVDMEGIIRENIRPELNREGLSKLQLSTSLLELDHLLASFDGSDYDPERIDYWCQSVEKSMDDLDFILRGVERLYRLNGIQLFRTHPKGRSFVVRTKAVLKRYLRR